jgi:Fic family protein
MPNALKVPELMSRFVSWLHNNTNHPVVLAVDAHFKLVSIHPFVDGNGRTARLLMNMILMQAGYPPAIIRKEDRKRYIDSIEKAQLGGSLSEYYSLMYEAINRSLDMYIHALQGKEQQQIPEDQALLKIGELAKIVDETVPTIRHWTKQGLLQVKKYSVGGYQLYDRGQVETVRTIRRLQNTKRLTIVEIKRELEKVGGGLS